MLPGSSVYLLLIVAISGSMTIGLFYVLVVCAATALTVYQSRSSGNKPDVDTLENVCPEGGTRT
jgi:hypothetical protein